MNQGLRFIKYLLVAKTKHGVHSPFVFNLVTQVIQDKTNFKEYEDIELLRRELMQDSTVINVIDLGAGSQTLANNKRAIKDIAKNSAKPKKYAQLLFRLVKHFRSKNILELGTSLGISSLYLAKADKESIVITIEGCPEIANKAKENFEKLQLGNIKQVVGNFDEVLSANINSKLDFVFIDGNHRKQPTLNYFDIILKHSHNKTVFVFDDIHWSEEMQQAWEEIKKHPQVTVTIDLFFIGIVFIRPEQSKEHFVIRF